MNEYAMKLLDMSDDGYIRQRELILALLRSMDPEKVKGFYESFLSDQGYYMGNEEEEEEDT